MTRKYCGSSQYINKDSTKYILRDVYSFSHAHYEEVDKEQASNDLFRILDLNKDGKITVKDFEILIQAALKEDSASILSTKTTSIRDEKSNKIVDDMLRSINSLTPSQLDVALKVFAAYDADGTNFIDKQDLPLVLSDILSQLGMPSEIDRSLLMSRLVDFDLRSKGRISKKEFEYFYRLKFGFN